MRKLIVLLPLFLFLAGCNESVKTPQKETVDSTSATPIAYKTGKDMAPEIWTADSLQAIYYDDPDGDSLRYSRFFTFSSSSDAARIKEFLQDLDVPFRKTESVRDCRSEGKIYLLSGEEIRKTLYFSRRGDSCSYLYFIKDGSFLYFPLTRKQASFIGMMKAKARKP